MRGKSGRGSAKLKGDLKMTATEILKQDHREAMGLFERLEGTDEASGGGGSKDELFDQLKGALTLHTKLEEQIFYPALENFDETRDLIKESYREHRKVDQLLAETNPAAGDFTGKLSELRRNVEAHVDEEESEMFPKAERLLGQARLQEMGRQMEQMKKGQSATA
jgi:hemerythrin-like domain-containing protein